MPVLVRDPLLADQVKSERAVSGADRFDEVWEGVYVMPPMPTSEHQQIVGGLFGIIQHVVAWPGLGKVFPGINLSDREDDWTHNYRVPDVAVFLNGCPAKDFGTHWTGPADFLVEVCSPEDETRSKTPFYEKMGVRELLIVDRDPWVIEFYRLQSGRLEQTASSTPADSRIVQSAVVPLTFRLLPGATRPQIEVVHADGKQRWLV